LVSQSKTEETQENSIAMFNSNKARRGNQLKLLGNFSVIRYLGAVCHRHVHDGMLSLMERRSCNNPTRKFSPRGTTKQTLFQAKIVEVSRTHVMQPTKQQKHSPKLLQQGPCPCKYLAM